MADRLVHFFCKSDLVEALLGDLHEYFEREPRQSIPSKLKYWRQVFAVLRPWLLKRLGATLPYAPNLRINLLFALRHLKREKGFTLINVLGLACGLTTVLFIWLYVVEQWSYDRHWPDKQRVYRVYNTIHYGDYQSTVAMGCAPFTEIFSTEFPEVESVATWIGSRPLTFKHDGRLIKEENIILANQAMVEMFSMEITQGDGQHALDAPNTIILSETAAHKYFGTDQCVGQSLLTNEGRQFVVTAVFKDLPANSHFTADLIYTTINDRWSDPSKVSFLEYWTLSGYRMYLRLEPGTDPAALEKKFESIYEKYLDKVAQAFSGQSWKEFLAEGNTYRYGLQPLEDIHLRSGMMRNDGPDRGDIQELQLFVGIGILILLLTFSNYVNLIVARSTTRIREIAMRKALGAHKRQLYLQFCCEILVLSMLVVGVSVALTYLIMPAFKSLSGSHVIDPLFNVHNTWFHLLLVTFLGTLLAGIYPATLMSQFQLAKMARSLRPRARGGLRFRNALVFFQFAITSFMVFGLLAIYQQMTFVQERKLGYDRSNVMLLKGVDETSHPRLKAALSAIPDVQEVSGLRNMPTDIYTSQPFFYRADDTSQAGKKSTTRLWVDESTISAFGMELVAGRNFRPDGKGDSLSVILNEKAVRDLHLEPALGAQLKVTDGSGVTHTVIGVVKNFQMQSLHSLLTPTAFHYAYQPRTTAIRYKTDALPDLLSTVERAWSSVEPNEVMDFDFLEDRYDRLYESEKQTQQLFSAFVIVAMAIACMGLLGLTAQSVIFRKKEMGIRKALGASAQRILALFNAELTRPIIGAIFVGCMGGYWIMSRWLQDFAYRAIISWENFVLVGCTSLLSAVIVISVITMKQALRNPVDSLRYE